MSIKNAWRRIVHVLFDSRTKKQAISSSYKDSPTPEPEPPGLLSLPPELFDYIIDYASLADRILLSQNCHGLHGILKTDCRSKFNQQSREGQILLRSDISQRLPDHFLCDTCRRLHLIDFRKKPSPADQCYQGCVPDRTPIACSSFKISHQFVQTAVKLTRMQNMHEK